MGLLTALFGAVIGSLVTSFFADKRQRQQNKIATEQQQKQNRITMMLQIYEQYESPAIALSRTKVISLLKKSFSQSPPLSYEQIRSMSLDSGSEDLHQFLHFFERVAILFDEGYLDRNLFKSTLATPFYSYYVNYIVKLIELSKEREEPKRHWMQPIENLALHIEAFEDFDFSEELFFPPRSKF